MPKRVDGLHGGGKNVLHELAGMLRQMLVWHNLILSNVELVPAPQRLYNQGNIHGGSRAGFGPVSDPGNRWPCSCIRRIGNRMATPNERGRTWTNVSRA